jgi:hypothetical protein
MLPESLCVVRPLPITRLRVCMWARRYCTGVRWVVHVRAGGGIGVRAA